MTSVCCPGSFDPVTLGHLDVVGRATGLFERVTVAVLVNEAKRGLFDVDERLDMLRTATANLPGVSVTSFSGLLVDFCAREGIAAVVKGVRTASDLDYELPMAGMNRALTGLETVFVPTSPRWAHVSSSLVKEVASHGGDVDDLLPDGVGDRLRERLGGGPR